MREEEKNLKFSLKTVEELYPLQQTGETGRRAVGENRFRLMPSVGLL
jgi:hypothetical protein